MAVSDPTATIASPHSVVENAADPGEVPGELLAVLEDLSPARLVVGIPRHMDGSEGEMADEARAFAEDLERRTGIAVEEWDERLSSEAARKALLEAGASRKTRRAKGSTDMMAAALVLRSYLGSLP